MSQANTSSDSAIGDAFEALLGEHGPPDTVRAIESGGNAESLWAAIDSSGFADALVDESSGGSGLSLAEALPLWVQAGAHALPLALAETMLARAWLAQAGITHARGPICFAPARQAQNSMLHCPSAALARTAESALVQAAGEVRLLPIRSAQAASCAFELDLALEWSATVWREAPQIASVPDLKLLQALCVSAYMAGALHSVFTRTLAWANDREQFGRAIGKFQAIQHQLAVLAEEAFSARIAVQIACQPQSSRLGIDPVRIAIAKARTSEAALQGAQIAHAIHGAIGFTSEFDLQLFTRRLHAWRLAAGSESAWHKVLGEALLAQPAALPSLDFIRAATDQPLA